MAGGSKVDLNTYSEWLKSEKSGDRSQSQPVAAAWLAITSCETPGVTQWVAEDARAPLSVGARTKT